MVGVLLGCMVLTALSLKNQDIIAPSLVIIAAAFSRPNLWGEQLSHVSLALYAAAILIAFVQNNAKSFPAGRVPIFAILPLCWIALGYLWLLTRASVYGLGSTSQILGGFLSSAACVLAVAIVAADLGRRIVLAKAFVAFVGACCFSYVLTAAVWLVFGTGVGVVTSIHVGTWPEPQPVYFPFTTTVSTQSVFGLQLPRFVGFGREPGWMALYGCVAYLMLPMVRWSSRVLKVTILLGTLGTISTAGFAVLLLCIVIRFISSTRGLGSSVVILRLVFGLCLMAFALWAALYAPVLGFDAKGEQNELSLSERSLATEMGFRALASDPFSGGLAADKVGAVNLVAAIAAYGLPFSFAMGVACIAPLFRHPKPWQLLPLSGAIFVTLLTSQPALDSAWVFALASLAAYVAASEDPDRYGIQGDARLAGVVPPYPGAILEQNAQPPRHVPASMSAMQVRPASTDVQL